jgi:hypothetical protein
MKAVKKATLGLALLGLLCMGAVWVFRTHEDAFTHDDAFTEEGLLEADASDLRHTIVIPHFETPLARDENVLWCGTFQLAWNEACSLVGEDLHFSNEPAMVGILNKKSFTKQDLDAQSYVAVAGFVKDGIHGRIVRQLEDTFKGQAKPRYIPPKGLTPRPQDIVAYSYLFKNLEFPVPFERIEKPLVFGTDRAPCFGIGEEYKSKHIEMLQQCVILNYESEDDFVIELRTKSTDDRVILAKTQPGATLGATVEAVQKRAANPAPMQAQLGDVLKVPKVNFDVTRKYGELEDKRLLVANPKVAGDLRILSALQNVRFQFDEKGVRLRSESHIAFGCAATPPPPPTRHIMVFDKPFLIVLQRSGADVPYFALWVGNPELLVKTN